MKRQYERSTKLNFFVLESNKTQVLQLSSSALKVALQILGRKFYKNLKKNYPYTCKAF